MAIHPYLFFSGNCLEAFERYHEIFGGELTVVRNGDMPPEGRMEGASEDSIMHVNLTAGDNVILGSDDPSGDGGAKVGASVCYVSNNVDDARRVFEALSENGTPDMPFTTEMPWSQGFGMCTDRFGVPWMVDTAEG